MLELSESNEEKTSLQYTHTYTHTPVEMVITDHSKRGHCEWTNKPSVQGKIAVRCHCICRIKGYDIERLLDAGSLNVAHTVFLLEHFVVESDFLK